MAALRYREQDSPLTLAEGIEEYERSFPELIDARDVSDAAGAFFSAHDRCHVVFGLDTSLPQEGMADTWTIFGSDIPLRDYLAYLKQPEVSGLLAEIGYWKATVESVKAIPQLYRAYRHARHMTKKWPFWDNDTHLDRPIGEIRREFGIEVVPIP